MGITGSAGKTTTKDLAAAILATQGSCHSSPMSKNYPDGIAQIILSVRPTHKFCVMEVSGGQPGELDRPMKIFTPEIGVLTLVAKDHFKAFTSVDEIAAEKSKLISALPAHGTAVLNIDDPRVRAIGESCKCNVLWIGEDRGATLRLIEARSSWPEPLTLKLEYNNEVYFAKTQLHGKHLSLSVLAALGVGIAADVPLAEAIAAISEIKPTEGRMQVVDGGEGVTFVRDDWKAPHWSLQSPLEFMADARAKRKIVVIGTLSDYSLSASKLYPKVARQALAVADLVIFAGPHALRALKARKDPDDEKLKAFTELEAVSGFLASELQPGDLVMLKGSNKADHLVRLYYDRQKPVQCWVSQCGIPDFCGGCSRLYRVSGSSAEGKPANTAKPLAKTGSGPHSVVVIGLGNPGEGFVGTPHNLGYQVVDQIAQDAGGSWVSTDNQISFCKIVLADQPVTLVKPEVPINRSGPVIRRYLEETGNNHDACVLAHDDIDLALGDVRVKHSGSAGGHKGVDSVISALATSQLTRIRVGFRLEQMGAKARDSVTRAFPEQVMAQVRQAVQSAALKVEAQVEAKNAELA
ncbi:aminoacyl-tRNA hydrolase [Hydrocarboniclastica marina]|uniref:aminoacyl-tRNA hydrolase n=1 Tax=Hydrocarboniclastica marina TaxID=2259620 RepID=UPI0015622C64|nr:aminoacyl-tRNA hydrolase [Hydrocarboniclastica marina]